MPGLDPGIHALDASNCRVDCRVKPGNDGLQESTSPRIGIISREFELRNASTIVAEVCEMTTLRSLAAACSAIALLALAGHDASSQAARTLKIVVPFAPGGGSDILARLLADQIGRAQGPTIVIENRPGAGTVIATEAVSR